MSSLTKPNGPLSERTYWRRRVAVIAVALLLVVALGRLLTGSSDGQEPAAATTNDSASLTSQSKESVPSIPSETSAAVESSDDGTKAKKSKKQKADKKADPVPAVDPTQNCLASDITVEPRVADQPGGDPIALRLLVRTDADAACLWTVSAETLTMKITSGKDNIWYSSECPKALPDRNLVIRTNKATRVRTKWDARRSDEGCTKQRAWALPGTYHLEVAALGGDPAEERFVLETPTPETVAPEPTKAQKKAAEKKAAQKKAQKKAAQKKANKNKAQKKKAANKKSND